MESSFKISERGPPLEKAKKAVILLHGRGSSSENILGLSSKLAGANARFIAPQAPQSTWYPYSFLEEERLNEPWLSRSIHFVHQLIDQCSEQIGSSKVYLIGFSQGACLALEAAGRKPRQYGGVIAFTGGLIGKTINQERYQGSFQQTKIYLSNSDNDPHVPLKRSQESKAALEALQAEVILQVFPNRQHTIMQEEIDSVNNLFFPEANL